MKINNCIILVNSKSNLELTAEDLNNGNFTGNGIQSMNLLPDDLRKIITNYFRGSTSID